MQTPHCISPFFSDYQAISYSALLPTPALRFQNSRDTAPIAISPLAVSALPLPGAAENNPPQANEKVESVTEFINDRELWREDGTGLKSDRFVGIFTNYKQAKE